jgi:uncharacterized membrane protein
MPGEFAPRFDRARNVMRILLAIFFSAAGIAHLAAPEQLLLITPTWVPFASQVIVATGVFEIAASVALVTTPRVQRIAGIALAIYALCVWPANFRHAIEGIDLPPIPNSWLYHGPRLALQPVIIWWALFSAEVIDWPWRRTTNRRIA